MQLSLDRHSQPAVRSRIDFLGAFGADSLCQLSWEGFYRRFLEGRKVGSIAKDAGKRPADVLNIYGRYFKEIFCDREYDEYCDLLPQAALLKRFPADPTLQFLVEHAFAAGMKVVPIHSRDHAKRVHVRNLELNGKLCRVHRFGPGRTWEIMLEPLDRHDIRQVGIVHHNPQPVRALIIPTDVIRDEQVLRRTRNGTHVRVDPRRDYPRSIAFSAAA